MINITFIFLAVLGLLLLYVISDYFIISRASYAHQFFSDEIIVHFIHGSYPRKNCEDQRKRVGGLLGGHVEIEIEDTVFGFEFDDEKSIHIFSRKDEASFNAKFTIKTKDFWRKETKHDKLTSFVIPLEKAKKEKLAQSFRDRYKSIPYDYSFLGMRCTSSTYEDLSELQILPRRNRIHYIIAAFYPRILRKKMVLWANYNGLKIIKKKGIDCRVWE